MVTPYFKSDWLENVMWAVAPSFLGRFPWEFSNSSVKSSDLEAGSDLGLQRVIADSSESQRPDTYTRRAFITTQITEVGDCVYICLYKRKDNAWRLSHAKVRRHENHNLSGKQESQAQASAVQNNLELQACSPNMDKVLFLTLRAKLVGKTKSSSLRDFKSWIWLWRPWAWPWKWRWKLGLWKSWDWLCQMFNPTAISGLEFWEV